MKLYLSRSERGKILKSLSEKQQDALFTAISMTYKSEFGNLLASFKGTQQWDFYRYVDHGEVTASAKCQCGKSLRYEFILKNIKTGQLLSLGSTHFQEELQIPDDIAQEVFKSIHNINYDLDEILIKVRNNWNLGEYTTERLDGQEFILPLEIRILLEANLPILERHISRVDEILNRTDSSYSSNYYKDKVTIPEEIKEYISDEVLSLVDTQVGAKYLLIKKSATSFSFEQLTELNFVKGYYPDREIISKVRYKKEYYKVNWTYHSALGSFIHREANYGPKMCIAKIDYFSQDYCGLMVICGMTSIPKLQKVTNEFILKNKLSKETESCSNELIKRFEEYNKLKNKYVNTIDYLKLHEYQIEIGKLGEAYVYDLEREKLKGTAFYNQVDKTKALDSKNGYDIFSFEKDGTPIYIEVKTSVNIGEEFYISNHELDVAKSMMENGKKYVIYRVENILADSENEIIVKKIYDLVDNKELNLEPTNWKVTLY